MRRSPLNLIFLLVFVDLLGYGMILPLLPFYVQRLQAGAAAAGLAGALYSFMQLLSGPALGALSDYYGRRPVLLACMLGTALAYVMLGLAGSLWVIFVAIMLDGITGGNLTTAYAYIADVTPPEGRARGMGLVGAAFGLGLMVGPALGGSLSRIGMEMPAYIAAALALANVVISYLVLPESLPPEHRSPVVSWHALNSAAQLNRLFRLPSIRTLLLAIFTLNLAFSGLQINFPLYSQARFGWDSVRNGYFYAYVGVCAVLVQGVLFGWLQTRLGEKRLVILGLTGMTLGLAGMVLVQRGWQLFPVVGLVALGSGVSIPSLTSLVSNRVSPGEQGRLMGGTQTLLSLAMILGPLMAGIAFDGIGFTAPYLLGSLLSAGTLLLAHLGLRAGLSPRRQALPPAEVTHPMDIA